MAMLHISQSNALLLYSQALDHALTFRCVSVIRLSKRVGVSAVNIYRYRAGVVYPSRRVHLLLCEVLGFDLPYYGQGVRRVGRFKNVPK